MSTHSGFPVWVVWAGEAKERTYSSLLVPGRWAAPFGAVQMNPICPNIPCSLFPAVIPSQGQGHSSQMSPELSLSPALSDPTGSPVCWGSGSFPDSTRLSLSSGPWALCLRPSRTRPPAGKSEPYCEFCGTEAFGDHGRRTPRRIESEAPT